MSSAGKPLRILIISQFYYPDVTACAFRIHETALLLRQMGCEVEIIAGEPHKGQADNQKIDDQGIKVSRVKLLQHANGGKWAYIAHYLSFMFGAIKLSARHKGHFDIVWATSPPLFTAVAGMVIAFFRRARFCLDIRDIWPDSAVVAGQISGNGALYSAARIVEKFLYRSADLITCVARPMADYIRENSGDRQPTVIYNAIPGTMVADKALPVEANPEPMEILYIGNMGFCQNLSLVLDAAKILKDRKIDNIRFVLIGQGIEKSMLEENCRGMQLDNVKINGVVAKETALEKIRQTHALMLHLKDDGTMDKTIPSKVFDYMAGGRPILYGLKGEACEILGSVTGNLYYDPADPQQLADQAVFLRNNYEKLATAATANLELVKNKFLRERMAEELLQAFNSLKKQV